ELPGIGRLLGEARLHPSVEVAHDGLGEEQEGIAVPGGVAHLCSIARCMCSIVAASRSSSASITTRRGATLGSRNHCTRARWPARLLRGSTYIASVSSRISATARITGLMHMRMI